ncbi:transposase [Deinococcus radiophilus]|uniref:Transposase DDE domain-containing protein n=1 Tax=Deinococcus radiophilus TaxID=32062 RepID=A0A3S0JMY5_9DEIO|nr:hypothetical protein EJ104_11200 [Deinococcus radiophilus]
MPTPGLNCLKLRNLRTWLEGFSVPLPRIQVQVLSYTVCRSYASQSAAEFAISLAPKTGARSLDAGKVKRRGRGRPKVRARFILADRAYSGAKAHECCERRGMHLVCPPKRNHKRPRSYDRGRYRQRNVIERLVNRLKRACRIATRFEKRICHFEAMVTLACVMEWL